MKLYHITKQGTLHFQLKNGRLAAVYPDTGYVRVSHSLDFIREEPFKEKCLSASTTRWKTKTQVTLPCGRLTSVLRRKQCTQYIWSCTTKPAGPTKYTSTLTKRTTKWSRLIASCTQTISKS